MAVIVEMVFETEEQAEDFVSQFSNSLEQALRTCDNDEIWFDVQFKYHHCFPAWGWDGKGNRKIYAITKTGE